MASGQEEGRGELRGTPGLVGAELPSPVEPSGSGHQEQTTETRVPYQDPYKVRPASPARITDAGLTSPRKGQGRRKTGSYFRKVSSKADTKIRPLVPKKILAPSKALERGSPARNVTSGVGLAGLGSEVSPRDQRYRPMAGGHRHLSPTHPACKILELVPAASCLLQRTRRKA